MCEKSYEVVDKIGKHLIKCEKPWCQEKLMIMMIGKAQNLPNIIVMYVCNFYSYLNNTYVCMYVFFEFKDFILNLIILRSLHCS
jgi:hypothetical protein